MNSNSNVKVSDDHKIEIIPSPDHSPSQSHEQTPAAASASPQDESRRVNDEIIPLATSPAASPQDQNEMTPEEPSSDLKEQLYHCIGWDEEWSKAESIIDKYPNVVRIPLNDSRDTALHAAVRRWNTTFVEGLVKLMSPEDMLIPNSDGMLPVHLAALDGNHELVQCLSSQNLLDKMAIKDIQRLFFMTISCNMFDVATKLFQKCPTDLANARDEEQLTALHMLAQKPPEILNERKLDKNTGDSSQEGLELLKRLWTQVRKLEYKEVLDLITRPSALLSDAVSSGNVEVVKYLVKNSRRELLETLSSMEAIDFDGNNILHFFAYLPVEFEALSGFRATIQMRRQVAWFKEMEKYVPPELRRNRNKKGKTPMDVFYDEHKKLSEEIKGTAKGIAESGMLVATLVATVAFAAALTVPGDKTNAWFIVFILTNAVALFASSASLLSFLSNFTSSRFAGSEFVISLHPSLTFGPVLLFISVAAMVVAFAAASFLIFDHTSKWVAYVVASMGVFPILLFVLFQFNFFDDLLWSRYYRMPKVE